MSDEPKRFMDTSALRSFARKQPEEIGNNAQALALIASYAANQLLLLCDILDELRALNAKTLAPGGNSGPYTPPHGGCT